MLSKTSATSTSAPQLASTSAVRATSMTSPASVSRTALDDVPTPTPHHKTFSNPPTTTSHGMLDGSPISSGPSASRFRNQTALTPEKEADAVASCARPVPIPSAQGVSNLASKFLQQQQPQQPTNNGHSPSHNDRNSAKPLPKPAPVTSSSSPAQQQGNGHHQVPVPARPVRPAPAVPPKPVPSTPNRPTSVSTNGGTKFCSGCGKPLQEATALHAINGLWHSQCFGNAC